MLRTSADRLYRCAHVTIAGNQVPARLNKIAGLDLSTQIDRLWRAIAAILQRLRPYSVAITFHHCMRATKFDSFLRVEGGVNPTEDHIRTALTRYFADLIPAKSVRSVDADTHHIAREDPCRIHLEQSLIDKYGIAENFRC